MSLPCAVTKLCQASPSPCLASAPAQEADLGDSKAQEQLKKIDFWCLNTGNMSARNVPHVPHGGITTDGTAHKSQLKTVPHKAYAPTGSCFLCCFMATLCHHRQQIANNRVSCCTKIDPGASFAESLGMALIS